MRGVDNCFKNRNLICDQHPTCDPAKDTGDPSWGEDPRTRGYKDTGDVAWDEFNCFDRYKERRLTPKDATFKCQSVNHNDESKASNLSLGIVMIEAIRCDGNPTCWKKPGEDLAPDETFCDNDLLTKVVPGESLMSRKGSCLL